MSGGRVAAAAAFTAVCAAVAGSAVPGIFAGSADFHHSFSRLHIDLIPGAHAVAGGAPAGIAEAGLAISAAGTFGAGHPGNVAAPGTYIIGIAMAQLRRCNRLLFQNFSAGFTVTALTFAVRGAGGGGGGVRHRGVTCFRKGYE